MRKQRTGGCRRDGTAHLIVPRDQIGLHVAEFALAVFEGHPRRRRRETYSGLGRHGLVDASPRSPIGCRTDRLQTDLGHSSRRFHRHVSDLFARDLAAASQRALQVRRAAGQIDPELRTDISEGAFHAVQPCLGVADLLGPYPEADAAHRMVLQPLKQSQASRGRCNQTGADFEVPNVTVKQGVGQGGRIVGLPCRDHVGDVGVSRPFDPGERSVRKAHGFDSRPWVKPKRRSAIGFGGPVARSGKDATTSSLQTLKPVGAYWVNRLLNNPDWAAPVPYPLTPTG